MTSDDCFFGIIVSVVFAVFIIFVAMIVNLEDSSEDIEQPKAQEQVIEPKEEPVSKRFRESW